jgi:hypothetical protein
MPKFYILYHRQLQAAKHTMAQYAEWNDEFFDVVNTLEETDRNEVMAAIHASKLTTALSALRSSLRHTRFWAILRKARQECLRVLRKPYRVDAAKLGLHTVPDIANYLQELV